jgi:spermidine synthase
MAVKFDRRWVATGLLSACGAAFAPKALAQGQTVGSIARRESQYNTIFIDPEGPYISMRFGINNRIFTESLYNPRDQLELPVIYTRFMTVAMAYAQGQGKIMEIGLGGGRTASYLHDFVHDAQVTVAELDPEVIALAQQYFGVRPDARLRLVERDGRIFARTAPDHYDVILVDAYRGTFVPFHLTTREFYTIIKGKLAPNGAVAQNIDPETLNEADITTTMKAVFQHVDRYAADGNVVLVAYNGAPKTNAQLQARANALQSAYHLRYPLGPMLSQRRGDVHPAGGRVLTDDFAPVEYEQGINRDNQRR